VTWLTVLIEDMAKPAALSPQAVAHFLFQKFLYQTLHPQTEKHSGYVFFGVETSARHLVEALANPLSWWYSVHGVRFLYRPCPVRVSGLSAGVGCPFGPTNGFLAVAIVPHAVSLLQEYMDITCCFLP